MASVGQSTSSGSSTGSSTSTGTSFSRPNQQLLGLYQNEYQNALGRNDSNYQNILGAYTNSINNAGQQFNNISSGYGGLEKQVLGGIKNIGQSQSQAIQDQYKAALGQQGQSLVNAGLGNTTVTGAMSRGLTLDSQKAQIALQNQIAQLTAGYQSQLGSAGLQAKAQGAQTQAGLAGQYMGVLGSYKTPYPSWPQNESFSTQSSQSQQQSHNTGSSGQSAGLGGSGGTVGGQGSGTWAAGQPGAGNYPWSGGTSNPQLGAYQVYGGGGMTQQQLNQQLGGIQGGESGQAPGYPPFGTSESGGGVGAQEGYGPGVGGPSGD